MALSQNIAILILAAGASSRMGRTKQLLPWADTTLLGNAIRNAKACNSSCVAVVLGANAASIQNEIKQRDVELVENTNWQTGLGSSIACGAKFLRETYPKIQAILVMLADQPLIDTVYLNTMIAAFDQNGNGVSTAYKNRAGVPALFPESYFQKLATLHDDFGAKDIINGPSETFTVLAPGHKTQDVDTKTDYENLINNSTKSDSI